MPRFTFDGAPEGATVEGDRVGSWNGFPIVRANAADVLHMIAKCKWEGVEADIVGDSLVIWHDGEPDTFRMDSIGRVAIDGYTWTVAS